MSHDLTLSARQRIVVYREMARLERRSADSERLEQLKRSFAYFGDRTCAADGLCATTCPVDIDTGLLVKAFRQQQSTPWSRRAGAALADRMHWATGAVRFGLALVDEAAGLRHTRMTKLTAAARRLSYDRLPLWTKAMPKAASKRIFSSQIRKRRDPVVYFPSCINRTMGPAKGVETLSLTRTTENLLEKAGYEVVYPDKMDRLCCGMPFASKGLVESAAKKAAELGNELLGASDNGRFPVLCDVAASAI